MKHLVPIFIVLALMVGCKQEAAPPPPQPKATPVQTPEDIAKQIRQSTDFLGQWLAGNPPPPNIDGATAKVSSAVSAHRATDNGKTAIAQVSHEVEEIIKQARDAKQWKLVRASIMVYAVLVPNSTKYNRLKETAQLQMSRPMVVLNGFFVDEANGGQVYAFVNITDPTTGEETVKKIREGEEFDNLRFVKIIGERRGIQLEYLPIPGDTFDVMK